MSGIVRARMGSAAMPARTLWCYSEAREATLYKWPGSRRRSSASTSGLPARSAWKAVGCWPFDRHQNAHSKREFNPKDRLHIVRPLTFYWPASSLQVVLRLSSSLFVALRCDSQVLRKRMPTNMIIRLKRVNNCRITDLCCFAG